MTLRTSVSDAQRRTRLLHRHRLHSTTAAESVTDVVASVVALHATTASTVYLSTWARLPGFGPADLETALYEDRSLIRQLAMRRTLFVFDRAALPDAIGAVGPRVTASERTNMLRDLRRSPDFDDPDGWIDTARAAVRDELAGGGALTSRQLRERLPDLDGYVEISPGKSYGGRSPMGPRVLNMMSAAGDIVRGPNAAGWHLSRPAWSAMGEWLGEPLAPVDVADGHRRLIERYVRAFGPVTETDIVWWLGSTKTAVRSALADLDVVEVTLDSGEIGYLGADDLDPLDELPPEGFLLPELDPTTMGHKQRDFYLGAHGAHVFDSNGNGGQTAWWDGRIVGGWRQLTGGEIELHLLESVPASAQRDLRRRADALAEWLGEVRPSPGYPAPFMKVRG
ncbi:winged helix DNA-binding domain-containing protein [Gordonia soli]|uniref:Winged helix DNA-binding domain-containing protein n=1 Tax=Gordonia soli NBRC 108243 TaxID=1223545 RepID=M0QS02_9ACTN|nr:winged helix DNA-binding domain-containing protein [Gordonia soli]GAC70592.1 hypothetical protein GS4_37_00190 [Gordonia soli NBRC 108243]